MGFSTRRGTKVSKSRVSAHSSPQKELPDRDNTNSMSIISGGTDEYVERLVSNPAEDEELAAEIAKRENSAVREKVNMYDQLHAKSKMPPPLMEVQAGTLSRQSAIYNRVQSFEMAEQQSKIMLGPKIEDLRNRRETNEKNRFVRAAALSLPAYSL